ncbi:MAG: SusC/RagA family TonB-linked outer membrane protein, partial [Cyclobacteriaceae bacterium]|nr:SusC/RagA family TonB-linked outer membrane protein [Cyclobacteriaceae bacterium]
AQIRDTRAGYVTNVDSHWIKDGSFIRGKNIALGYKFTESATSRLKMNKLRVYASVQNLFLIVDDELIGDPEVTPIRGNNGNNAFSQGMMWHEYPKPTIYMLGFQIGL